MSHSNGSSCHFEIRYPLYLIPHGGGYLSIVDPENTGRQLLVVCSSQELSLMLIYQFSLLSKPKQLNNDREFAWLLRSLKNPVSAVAFDPRPEGEIVNAVEVATVAELLEHRLQPDLSPWNYPVFLLANDDGFVSIESDDGSGELIQLLCLFSSREKAIEYQDVTGIAGDLCEFKSVAQMRTFLKSLDRSLAAAVALDPVIENETHIAKYCFAIEVLLEKYLVHEDQNTPNPSKDD